MVSFGSFFWVEGVWFRIQQVPFRREVRRAASAPSSLSIANSPPVHCRTCSKRLQRSRLKVDTGLSQHWAKLGRCSVRASCRRQPREDRMRWLLAQRRVRAKERESWNEEGDLALSFSLSLSLSLSLPSPRPPPPPAPTHHPKNSLSFLLTLTLTGSRQGRVQPEW